MTCPPSDHRVGVKRSREQPTDPQPDPARCDRRLTPTLPSPPVTPTMDTEARGANPSPPRPICPLCLPGRPPCLLAAAFRITNREARHRHLMATGAGLTHGLLVFALFLRVHLTLRRIDDLSKRQGEFPPMNGSHKF